MDAYTFMYEHAGYSWDPKRETPEQGRERCARSLAEAEDRYKADPDVFVVWDVDNIDSSEFEDTDEPRPLYVALLCIDSDPDSANSPDVVRGYDPADGIFERPGHVVGSLGGIDLAQSPFNDPYARVIVAELYSEFDAQREDNIYRSNN